MCRILLSILLLALSTSAGAACHLTWDYDAEAAAWLDGYRVYQSGAPTGGIATRELRALTCADAEVDPLGGPITMTAFRGDDESAQSDPASFDVRIVGTVRVVIAPGQ